MRQAIDAATTGPVAEGVVGAGTGMSTMGHKGGIGTASRVLDGFGTVGVLLLCNFGGSKLLRIGGVPVGETITAEREVAPVLDAGGSCIGIVLTDIPLDARQLERVARRVGLGLGRVGSVAHHGSGDIFFAGSTTNRRMRFATGFTETRLLADKSLDAVFTAVVDASEEAVTNAMFVADTVTGVNGHTVPGLPVDRVLEIVRGVIPGYFRCLTTRRCSPDPLSPCADTRLVERFQHLVDDRLGRQRMEEHQSTDRLALPAGRRHEHDLALQQFACPRPPPRGIPPLLAKQDHRELGLHDEFDAVDHAEPIAERSSRSRRGWRRSSRRCRARAA